MTGGRWESLRASRILPRMSYLLALAERLTGPLSAWEPARRQRHADFIRSQQMSDGGFRGREGDADLYYTGFAVRGLSILGEMTPADASTIATFLHRFDPARLNTVDLLSWLYAALALQIATGDDLLAELPADWNEAALDQIHALRRPDGGYAKSADGALGSTYHTFLVGLVIEMLGQPWPEPNAVAQFLYDQQREDGGFVEIAPMKRGGTNPTAAAAAVLNQLGHVDEELRDDVAHYLNLVWSSEGGFAANTRIPFPDGLSTFTALLTIQDLQAPFPIRADLIERWFTQQLEFPTGGFRGAAWDDQADVEYTFYGLGTLALLAAQQAE